jgi:hypothetical protein
VTPVTHTPSTTQATAGALDTGTWRRESSLATWTYELPLAPGVAPSAAIAACARGVLAALPGFATPALADWTTESAGDEAAVQARGASIDAATVDQTVRAHPDVIALALDLDLAVVAPDGTTEVALEDGAVVHIELDDANLVVWLSLHVDLYARRTFGVERDNDQLAQLNAPRLSAFLARLVERTGLTFYSVTAPSYGAQATPRGFE